MEGSASGLLWSAALVSELGLESGRMLEVGVHSSALAFWSTQLTW